MLRHLPEYEKRLEKSFSVSDITMCLSVRLHDQNPWIFERLKIQLKYYDPKPLIVIADQGSEPEHARQIENLCLSFGAEYVRDDYNGTFSLTKARNLAAKKVNTKFIFFADPDFFTFYDVFAKLANQLNIGHMGNHLDILLNFPIIHVNEVFTDKFNHCGTAVERSNLLDFIHQSTLYDINKCTEFIAPYSNAYLCRKDGFELAGGYNEKFVGYGSEDFELFLRFSLIMGQYPKPVDIWVDSVKPKQDAFFYQTPYSGFRKLFSAMSFQAEMSGFRIFHMYHPVMDDAPWRSSNDNKRLRFNTQVKPYIDDFRNILSYDWLDRDKKIFVLIKSPVHVHFFLSLRLAGYKLVPILDSDMAKITETEGSLRSFIARSEVEAVAIFNPYTGFHKVFKAFWDEAKEQRLKTIVVERGALPESWYYAVDVAYNDSDYIKFDFQRLEDLSEADVELAGAYKRACISGEHTLEQNAFYDLTMKNYAELRRNKKLLCFVPLQREEDMFVNHFTDGFCSYPNFLRELSTLPQQHGDIHFLIKQDPSNKTMLDFQSENVTICDDDANIRALIDLTDVTLCYNSNVGLLALVHGKPLFTIGNAFYNINGLGQRAANMMAALKSIEDHRFTDPPEPLMLKFLAWLLLRKYSFYVGKPIMKGQSHRKNNYTDMAAYQVMMDQKLVFRSGRSSLTYKLTPQSYLLARLQLLDKDQWNSFNGKGVIPQNSNQNPASVSIVETAERFVISKLPLKDKVKHKYQNNRHNFFMESKNPLSRVYYRLFSRLKK